MRKLNRLTMTLALLIMAVGGAWAEEATITLSCGTTEKTFEKAELPWSSTAAILKEVISDLAMAPGIQTITGGDGKVVKNGNENFQVTGTFSGKATVEVSYVNTSFTTSMTTITVTAPAPEPTEWELTSKDGKNWILDKMPANNVELQVEYFAESNLFLSKDALADKTSIAVTAGDLGVQFGDDGKSANTITEGTPMTVKYNGTKKILGMKVEKKIDNAYLKWDNDQKKLVATEIPAEVTTVANADADVTWEAGTYVVEGEITIGGKITLNGNVDLIIKDGAKLKVNQINGYNGNFYNLSIYGQANRTGELVVNSSSHAIRSINTLEVHSAKVTATSSNNDLGGFNQISTFNVYGGSVYAEHTGDNNGYGIRLSGSGPMNIFGGDVTAVGKGNNDDLCYGIMSSSVVNVTVYGGKLRAECAGNKALKNINLTTGAGYDGSIEYSSDKSTWSETVDANAKYVRAGY